MRRYVSAYMCMYSWLQQLCEDTGCSPEDLPEAMNDREKWRERVRDIRASSMSWWWWFQTIQFSISTLFSSIWLIDRTLSDATTLGQSGPGSYGDKGYSTFPKTPALQDPHHQIVYCHIQDTRWGSEFYPSAEMQSVLSAALADWAIIIWKGLFASLLHSISSYYYDFSSLKMDCPVGWGCRIHRLLLCRKVRPPPTTSVLDMTLNNLMVRFQQCWSFGECGVPLHCHRSQVHSGPEG